VLRVLAAVEREVAVVLVADLLVADVVEVVAGEVVLPVAAARVKPTAPRQPRKSPKLLQMVRRVPPPMLKEQNHALLVSHVSRGSLANASSVVLLKMVSHPKPRLWWRTCRMILAKRSSWSSSRSTIQAARR